MPLITRVRDYLYKTGVNINTNAAQQRYVGYYHQCLEQLGLPDEFTAKNIEYYTAWRWLNSTIKTPTLEKEIIAIKQVATLQDTPIIPSICDKTRARRITKGFSKARGVLDDPRDFNHPFTYPQYCKLIDTCNIKAVSSPAYHTFKVMIAVATWGMLRSSEYCRNIQLEYWQQRILIFDDIKFIKSQGIPTAEIRLKVTKTHQRISLQPQYSYIPCQCSDTIDKAYCPYCILKNFHDNILKDWKIPSNPYDPFMVGPRGDPFDYTSWLPRLKDIITWSGLTPNKQATHALRRTGATLMYQAGVKPIDIKVLGRWDSIAWLVYVKPDPKDSAATIPSLLAHFAAIDFVPCNKPVDTTVYI